MRLRDLFEAVEDDISASDLADTLRSRLYTYLYQLKQDGVERVPHYIQTRKKQGMPAKEYPIIAVRQFPARHLLRDLQDVAFVFDHHDGFMSGQHRHRKEGTWGIKHFVWIESFGESVSDILTTVANDHMTTVLRHEIQHVLDAKRFKGDPFKYAVKGEENSTFKGENNLRQYHNEPTEQNAYWHNLAEPLLKRLRFMAEYPENEDNIWALLDPLPEDFGAFLEQTVRSAPSAVARHFKRLTGQNRKRAISRLYLMHKKYWELMRAHPGNAEPAK